MRAAPALRLDVAQDPGWRAGTAVLGGAAALSAGLWLLESIDAHAALGWPLALAMALAGALAAARWLRHDTGELGWDGAAWDWRPRGTEGRRPVELRVAFDLGPSLLLELRPPHGRRACAWVVVSRARAGAAWAGLRAAVYCGAAAERTDSPT